jgi:hypothetical protein
MFSVGGALLPGGVLVLQLQRHEAVICHQQL